MMCGIAGLHSADPSRTVNPVLVEDMLALLRHRGPDEMGIYQDRTVALGSARLSIIDLAHGTQPIGNEDGTVWVVFNGEVFNHDTLRSKLIACGHHFQTRTDTEVIVHLYEEYGRACVEHLNGQFAFALWDAGQPEGTLLLARDRVGICPLFYAKSGSDLIFASEVKALLRHPSLGSELDPRGLADFLTLWSTLPPRTAFADVKQLPPGHTMMIRGSRSDLGQYWEPTFPEAGVPPVAGDAEFVDHLGDLLLDATRIRLNADVPVGAYLSGGLDSTTTASFIRRNSHDNFRTFSVVFDDARFDERQYQEEVVEKLDTDHSAVVCSSTGMSEQLADVVWHAESPLLRSAPIPMYLLSQHVREHDMKVVLTGEGADEFLGGYNIFKEDKVRRFWAREPESSLRPLLLNKLYGYVGGLDEAGSMRRRFFARHLTEVDRLDYSHLLRWANSSSLHRLFSGELRDRLDGYEPRDEINSRLATHPRYSTWTPLARAQYLEVTLFMSGYLLSSQGDRMLMAHSVEGRFPFLDHRVIEWAALMPPRLKLRGLVEKWALKEAARPYVPASAIERPKQPYRAPIRDLLVGNHASWVAEVANSRAVADAGVFAPAAVERLFEKARRIPTLSERDNMALMAVVSTQLLHELFVRRSPEPDRKAVIKKRVIGAEGQGQ